MVESRRSQDHNPQERSIIQLTESQLKDLIVESVSDALTTIGVDTKQPLEMQKDFQHLREWRRATSEIQKKSLLVVVGLLVSGMCAATWLGLKAMLAAPNLPPSGGS